MSERPTNDLLWIERARPEVRGKVSDLGWRVHRILDIVAHGIYHLGRAVLHERTDWTDPLYIELVVDGTISTYDFDELTRLVFASHDEAVRVSLTSASPRYLRICFSPREHNVSGFSLRHPTLEQAVATYRESHPIPVETKEPENRVVAPLRVADSPSTS